MLNVDKREDSYKKLVETENTKKKISKSKTEKYMIETKFKQR